MTPKVIHLCLTIILLVIVCSYAYARSSYEWNELGNYYYEQGKYDLAIDCYKEALELTPDDAIVWCNKGRAHSSLKEYDTAIKCYNRALYIDPVYYYAWDGKGVVYYYKGNYDQALYCFNKALYINPSYNASIKNKEAILNKIGYEYFSKGINLSNKGQYEESITYFDKALKYNYGDTDQIYEYKGDAYNNLGKYPEAIGCYEKILNYNSCNHDNFDIWYKKGICYSKLKKVDTALKCYDTLLNYLLSDNTYLRSDYYNTYKNKLIERYDKILEISPNNINALLSKSIIFKNQEKCEKAIKCCEKILKLSSKNIDAWFIKGQCYRSLGKYNIAISCFNKILQINPNVKEAKNQIEELSDLLHKEDSKNNISSNDGKIYFIRDNYIWMINPDESDETKLNEFSSKNIIYDISPDGKKIVYMGPPYNAGTAGYSGKIAIANIDGINKFITSNGCMGRERVQWFPDSKTFRYGKDIFDLKGNLIRTININEIFLGEHSPDGTKIIFYAYSNNKFGLWLSLINGNNIKKLRDCEDIPLPSHRFPFGLIAWAPDGKRFICESERQMDLPRKLYYMNLADKESNLKSIKTFDPEIGINYFSWTPDSQKICYIIDKQGVFLINPDGTGREQIIEGNYNNLLWSPNGKEMIIQEEGNDYNHYYYIFNLESKEIRRLTLLNGAYVFGWVK